VIQQKRQCHSFLTPLSVHESLLRLSLLAFNLASMLRIEYEDKAGSRIDLGRFQRDVLKAGGRVAKHARRPVLHVAQAVVRFWSHLIECIQRWTLPERFPKLIGPQPQDWMPAPAHSFHSEHRR